MKKLILLLMLLPILSGSAIAGQCTNVTIEGDWKHHKYASHRCDKMNYELRHIAETCRYKDRNYNTIMVRGYRNNRVHTWLEDIYTNEIIDATYPNVDYSKSVTFSAFSDKTKEKPTNVLLIYQDNELVKTAYSKDAPNGMPEAKQTKVRGVSKWDFSEVEEFLYGVLVEQIEAVKVLNPDAVEAEVQPDAEVKSKLDD